MVTRPPLQQRHADMCPHFVHLWARPTAYSTGRRPPCSWWPSGLPNLRRWFCVQLYHVLLALPLRVAGPVPPSCKAGGWVPVLLPCAPVLLFPLCPCCICMEVKVAASGIQPHALGQHSPPHGLLPTHYPGSSFCNMRIFLGLGWGQWCPFSSVSHRQSHLVHQMGS